MQHDDTKDLQHAEKCTYGAGHFALSDAGVHYLGRDKDGNDLPPLWICSRLDIVAKTRDEAGNEWGRLLEWQDDDKQPHSYPLPMEALEADGTTLRCHLANEGLHIAASRNARDLLCAYIKVWPVTARARCVSRLGWHDGVYVGPMRVFGETQERYVYQNAHALKSAVGVAGTLEDWREQIAAKALGNSRLVFVLSTAFAGPLGRMAGIDGGGFHLRGQSSTGKSTALLVAASVWGKPADYVRSCRSTVNGLEGVACQHNDGLLVLDELSQMKNEEVGEAAYLLANGQGKTRATKGGTARPPAQWWLLFLSAGEESLASMMTQGSKRSTAGQEIRMADVAADAGAGMGMFEHLHEHQSAASLAQALKQSSATHYGHAGEAYLTALVADLRDLPTWLKEHVRHFVNDVVPRGAGGQVERVARRFGLVAAAGELATLNRLTGWPQGEAGKAAKTCFVAWLEGFGGAGNHEERAICEQAQAFLEAHGASRFEYIHATNDQPIYNRAGFWRDAPDGGREYLMTSSAFETHICKGYDPKLVKNALRDAQILVPGKNNAPTQTVRLTGYPGPVRVYVLRLTAYHDPRDA